MMNVCMQYLQWIFNVILWHGEFFVSLMILSMYSLTHLFLLWRFKIPVQFLIINPFIIENNAYVEGWLTEGPNSKTAIWVLWISIFVTVLCSIEMVKWNSAVSTMGSGIEFKTLWVMIQIVLVPKSQNGQKVS